MRRKNERIPHGRRAAREKQKSREAEEPARSKTKIPRSREPRGKAKIPRGRKPARRKEKAKSREAESPRGERKKRTPRGRRAARKNQKSREAESPRGKRNSRAAKAREEKANRPSARPRPPTSLITPSEELDDAKKRRRRSESPTDPVGPPNKASEVRRASADLAEADEDSEAPSAQNGADRGRTACVGAKTLRSKAAALRKARSARKATGSPGGKVDRLKTSAADKKRRRPT